MAKISNIVFRLLTRDRNVWPGLLLPPQGNKDGNVSVASLQEEVDSQLDSQTGEHFLVPMAENSRTSQRRKERTTEEIQRAWPSNHTPALLFNVEPIKTLHHNPAANYC